MDKVILDTNILYSLVRLSANEKVKDNLGSCYELCTTTAALIEGVIKYREDLVAIKQLLAPIIKEEIKLISIGCIPFRNELIKTTFTIPHLWKACQDVLKK